MSAIDDVIDEKILKSRRYMRIAWIAAAVSAVAAAVSVVNFFRVCF